MTQIQSSLSLVQRVANIGVHRVGHMGAMHPPLVSHPFFIFAPRCRGGCKKIVFLQVILHLFIPITLPRSYLRLFSLKVPTKATYIPPAMFIYLPDPLNFLVRSLIHEGGWCTGCEFFFEVGPKREKCEKGGGCEADPHLGAKNFFWALRACTHL